MVINVITKLQELRYFKNYSLREQEEMIFIVEDISVLRFFCDGLKHVIFCEHGEGLKAKEALENMLYSDAILKLDEADLKYICMRNTMKEVPVIFTIMEYAENMKELKWKVKEEVHEILKKGNPDWSVLSLSGQFAMEDAKEYANYLNDLLGSKTEQLYVCDPKEMNGKINLTCILKQGKIIKR